MNSNHEEALTRLQATGRVGVDVETSGLDWRKNHIVGYVLTFGSRPDDSYYLPFRHAAGGNIEGVTVPQTVDGWDGSLHPMEEEVIKLLDRQGNTLDFHNGGFDLKFMFRAGYVKFDAYHRDSMLRAALIDEWQSSFSLDACAKLTGVEQKKISIYDHILKTVPEAAGCVPKATMGHYWRLRGDDPEAVTYAAGDGTTTWQLIDRQQAQLDEQELGRVHDVECRLLPVLARMTTRGVKIDMERVHDVKRIVEGKLEAALNALPRDFNSRAPTQVRALMESHGQTDWPTTPKGAPSFPEAWLEKSEIGQQIVASRKYANLLSSFINPMLETHIWNGRVHADYNQLRGDEYGTITGRLSSSNPNHQQIPKRNKELGPLFRSIFIPDDGMIWSSCDYSQMEPRLLAVYSRCKVLIDGYLANPPVDAHAAVAKAADIDRETGKRVNQTLITGGGKGVLTSRYGIPPNKVDEVWNKYFAAMPEIKALQRRAGDLMKMRGYVMSLLGRRSRLKDLNKSYVAVNRLLQCGNADIIKLKMVETDDYLKSEGYPCDMLTNVHDAIDYQFKEENRKHYEECLRIMTAFGPDDKITLDIPIVVDAGEGRDWSEATYRD